jgi:DnaJ-class molecular chaperone
MVADTKLYDALGVSPDADSSTIKKAYRKKSLKYHPDRPTGDEEKFKLASAAYEVLKDDEKRQLYDAHGEEGLKMGAGGGMPGGGFGDLFGGLFGGDPFGGGGGRGRDNNRTQDVVHELGCTLADLYNGKTKKIAINRNILCSGCQGTGSKNPSAGAPTCDNCQGSGTQIEMRRLAPGFVQQVQARCKRCDGSGTYVPRKDQCQEPKCNGGRQRKKETIEVNIDKGMMDGQKITFHGKADEEYGKTAGDVVLIVREKPSNGFEFKRQGMDLITKLEIKLGESLTGFRRVVKHLDGREIVITSPPGKVIKHEDVKIISGEGMPKYRSPFEKGRMFVIFEVAFPEDGEIDQATAEKLRALLPYPKQPDVGEDTEEYELEHFDQDRDRGPGSGAFSGKGSSSAYDEDEGGPGIRMGRGVECANQ